MEKERDNRAREVQREGGAEMRDNVKDIYVDKEGK